ncbi:hypothetical protein C5167_049293 [Papaver somniferum]|uniref:Uncharacterized protein n=1 Tax=Papaver somniferum TaxID=3469 RepID=A0A4Y7KPK6_PAPSO|nr:hypothetical protein C5167_049293 [Papaver somniferum]
MGSIELGEGQETEGEEWSRAGLPGDAVLSSKFADGRSSSWWLLMVRWTRTRSSNKWSWVLRRTV